MSEKKEKPNMEIDPELRKLLENSPLEIPTKASHPLDKIKVSSKDINFSLDPGTPSRLYMMGEPLSFAPKPDVDPNPFITALYFVNVLEREIKYITNSDHVFDPSSFRDGKVNGKVRFDGKNGSVQKDISFKIMYVHGAGFIKGHTDEKYFQLFYNNHIAFQVQIANSYAELEAMNENTFSKPPSAGWEVLTLLYRLLYPSEF